MSYGYNNETSNKKQGGKFGLNTGATLVKFDYNPNGGQDGTSSDCLDFSVKVGDKEYNQRFFPITKVWDKNSREVTDTNSDEYKDLVEAAQKDFSALVCDIARCFVSDDVLKNALKGNINSFENFIKILERLVKSNAQWSTKLLDVFLQYEWTPKGDNTVTFLELPRNTKHGLFICPHVDGTFVEERTSTHLRYIDANGIEHPIKRGEWFVNNAFANKTEVKASNSFPNTTSSNEINW